MEWKTKLVIMEYEYGEYYLKYRNKFGDVWQVGPHRFTCLDLQDQASWPKILDFEDTIDYVLTDPPWNAGNGTNFRRKAFGKDAPKVNFHGFLEDFTNICLVHKPKRVYVEFGHQNIAELQGLFEQHGYRTIKIFPSTYSGNKCLFAVFAKQPFELPEFPLVDESEVLHLIAKFEASLGSKTCFEPCLGWQGEVACAAHENGIKCFANEFNFKRFASVLNRFETGYKVKPELILGG